MTSLLSNIHVSYFIVFIEGILSFLSPCIVPILPIFLGYLAGQGDIADETGKLIVDRKKMLWHTLFFVIGISTTFFFLGASFTVLGQFLSSNKTLLTRSAGILIIVMGLIQIGFLEIKWLNKTHKFDYRVKTQTMNPLSAWLMGFTFSFAWTPCVGPMLASVLAMASSSKSALIGNLLVGLYALGFALPFLLLALFTAHILKWLEHREHWLKWFSKLGGVLLILMGIMFYTGFGNSLSSYLTDAPAENSVSSEVSSDTSTENSQTAKAESSGGNTTESEQPKVIPAFDFKLKDQKGKIHRLSDYKGKVVFLNFWATWCPPCKKEMPHIQELYEEYGENRGDVIFLSVSQPGGREQDVEGITAFMKENGYTWPSVMDLEGEVYSNYQISSIPTTFMIDKDGNIYGYVQGQLTKEVMKNIIEETQKK